MLLYGGAQCGEAPAPLQPDEVGVITPQTVTGRQPGRQVITEHLGERSNAQAKWRVRGGDGVEDGVRVRG